MVARFHLMATTVVLSYANTHTYTHTPYHTMHIIGTMFLMPISNDTISYTKHFI